MPETPHIARIYDYLLGGTANHAADREVGDQIIESVPFVRIGVRAQRDVLARAVRFLTGEAGVGQLLDIGSGLPTADNVHQVAQRIDPVCRVVYLDNDPEVVAHAGTLLTDDPAVAIAVAGDLRDPASILGDPEIRGFLDWDQPIGLLLCGILHYILDSERPLDLVRTLYDALPAGSYVFIHHLLHSDDPASAELEAALRAGVGRSQFRTLDEVRELFGGLELVPPGLVLVPDWRPEPWTLTARDHPVLALACAGVAIRH